LLKSRVFLLGSAVHGESSRQFGRAADHLSPAPPLGYNKAPGATSAKCAIVPFSEPVLGLALDRFLERLIDEQEKS
jgi:hypothetical protein